MGLLSSERVVARYKVAKGFYASSPLARTWPELIGIVEKDLLAAGQWKRKFVASSKAQVKATHEAVKKAIGSGTSKGGQSHGDAASKQTLIDAEALFKAADKALDDVDKKFTMEAADELGRVYSEIHNIYWDPEMFADGQTKADYGPRLIDPLLDMIRNFRKTYGEFWRRFYEKYGVGTLNITLHGLLPEEMGREARLNIELLKKLDGEGLEKGLGWYKGELEKLMKKTEGHEGKPTSMSIGMGVSALLGAAKKKGDKYTEDLAQNLLNQAQGRHPFSEKQRTLFQQKLDVYGIPPVNYNIWW